MGSMMTLDEFRRNLEQYWVSSNAEAMSLKDPHFVRERLHELYRRLDPRERKMADAVISEWLLSEDEGKRFDAQALIREFGIRDALDALLQLAGRLMQSSAPSATHELRKVQTIVADLRGHQT